VKQVLITGGAGFIGSHLAEKILARGHRVTLVDDESTGSPDNLHVVRNHFDCTYLKGSVTDRALMRNLLRDVDDVYHLAAAVGVRLIADQPIESIERNIQPVQVLLSELYRRAASGRRVRMFLASSSEVYGNNPKEHWTEEDSMVLGPTTQARWSYGAAKAIDEFLALAYWRQHHLPVVVGRLFNVVGPRRADYCGRVRYRRGFACPSGLAPEVMVSLVVELAAATGDVRLNGSPVGVVRGGGGSARFDITARLQDRNELQIDVTRPPPATVDRAAAAGGVLGEVRLEIQSGCTGEATGQPLDRGDMPPGAEPA